MAGNRNGRSCVEDGVDDDERQALHAEGLNPDDLTGIVVNVTTKPGRPLPVHLPTSRFTTQSAACVLTDRVARVSSHQAAPRTPHTAARPAVGAGNFVLQRGPDGDRQENEAEYHLGRNDQACVRASRIYVT
jgi:hypothetical protein